MNNCRDFIMQNLTYPENTAVFLKLKGENAANIQLIQTNLSKAVKGIEIGEEVNANVLIYR
jgi:hypothetical protein